MTVERKTGDDSALSLQTSLSPKRKPPISRFLVALSLACYRCPRRALLVCVSTLILCLTVGYSGLKLRMDWTYLFYAHDEIVVSGQSFRDSFPLPGDVAVLIDQGSPEERKIFSDRLAQRLLAEPKVFHHVLHRLDLSPLASKALYYLDEAQLREILAALAVIKTRDATNAGVSQGTGKRLLLKLLEDLRDALETRGRATYVPIWETLAQVDGDQNVNYLRDMLHGERYFYPTLADGGIGIVATKAGSFGEEFVDSSPLVLRLRKILQELSPTVGGLRIRLTGLPVMLHDERETVSRDSLRSSLISLILIILVFALGFGEFKRPVLAVMSLFCGLGWTIGFTTLVIGHLNFISVTLATMLMGIGIDFSIHFIFRYDEEMSRGNSLEEAIRRTLEGTGVDTMVGAVATATAFLALTQAYFRGISDFGIIAAGGTLLCLLSTITVLPALLSLFPGRARGKAGTSPEVLWLERLLLTNAKTVVLIWLLAAIGACFLANRVGFSYNLLEIQAQEISTVQTEIEMIRERNTVLSAEALSPDEETARERHQEFSSLTSVARVSSILPLLPRVSPTKQELVERIVTGIKAVHLPDRIPLDSAEDLLVVGAKAQTLNSAILDPDVERILSELRGDVQGMDPGPIQDGLGAFQKNVHEDLSLILSFLKEQRAAPPTLEDVPAELRLRYVSRDGSFRQGIQPVKNIWQRENLEEFLDQIKSVDPGVMGHPVIQEAILSAFHRTLDRTPWFTLFGVLLVFSLYLRSPTAIVLSLLPASLAVLMIFATMGALGMDFNVVNFVGLPISIGLGAVYGIHSLHRMRELGDETVLSSSTGPALLLSGVTDIVGFASLMSAQHQGISSLGLVMSVGIGVSFVASLVLLPTLRRVFRTLRGDFKQPGP